MVERVRPRGQQQVIEFVPTSRLRPSARPTRSHPKAQIDLIAGSIRQFGFISPIIADDDDQVVAGWGRLLAAKQVNLKTVPVIRLSHLSRTERRAYSLADNRLAESPGGTGITSLLNWAS
jgi:ParB-like chromosome segregation protein Spo0J